MTTYRVHITHKRTGIVVVDTTVEAESEGEAIEIIMADSGYDRRSYRVWARRAG